MSLHRENLNRHGRHGGACGTHALGHSGGGSNSRSGTAGDGETGVVIHRRSGMLYTRTRHAKVSQGGRAGVRPSAALAGRDSCRRTKQPPGPRPSSLGQDIIGNAFIFFNAST
jgi:hypothetical protein